MPKEKNDNSLGDAIKAARRAKGWTQSHLAGLLEISPRHLKGIENNGRKPSYNLLVRIIRELDISTDKIFHPEQA